MLPSRKRLLKPTTPSISTKNSRTQQPADNSPERHYKVTTQVKHSTSANGLPSIKRLSRKKKKNGNEKISKSKQSSNDLPTIKQLSRKNKKNGNEKSLKSKKSSNDTSRPIHRNDSTQNLPTSHNQTNIRRYLNTSTPSSTGTNESNETNTMYDNKPYKVIPYRTRYIQKYSVEELIYQIKFAREWRHRTLVDLQADFYDMFQSIITKLKKKYDLDSKVRLFLQHPDLKYSAPIFIALRPLRDLSVEAIMQVLEHVINSNLNVSLTSQFRIDIGIIQPPSGRGIMKMTCADLDNVMNERFYKRSIVVIPKIKNDHTCGARAVVVGISHLNNDKKYHQLRNPKKTSLQLKCAHKLLNDTNIPIDRALEVSQLVSFEIYYDVQIIVYQRPLQDGILYAGMCERVKKIFLYHNNGHFDLITNMSGFLGKRNYCTICLVPYALKETHKCTRHCLSCESFKCLVDKKYVKGFISCYECKQTCFSIDCFDKHKHKEDIEEGTMRSICETYRVCIKCRKKLKISSLKNHICGTYKCANCQKDNVHRNHLCYMRTITPPTTKGKFLYYDYECTADKLFQCVAGYSHTSKNKCKLFKETGYICSKCNICINCKDSLCGKYVHTPCLIVAHTVCDWCKDNPFTSDATCNNCGSRCDECHVLKKNDDIKGGIPDPCIGKCGNRETIFLGPDSGEKFASWLFNRNHANFTMLAHNAKSYDGIILLNHILSKTFLNVKCIYSGAKIISMTIPDLNIRCLDSMSFFPMALSKLPKIFGLTVEKGEFPHLFNLEANQNYIGSFPDIKYFDIDSKSTNDRQDFLAWYETKKNTVYNFREEMMKYCISDVTILREACTRFRDMVLLLTADKIEISKKTYKEIPINGVDAFACTTISALCLAVYRSKYLREKYLTNSAETNTGDQNEDILGQTGPTLKIRNKSSNKKKIKNKKIIKPKKIFDSSLIGLMPQGGYTVTDTYSKKSILWLELMQKRKKIDILHALNGGEYHIPNTKYKADGFCIDTNTIYSFHGCHWHGHPKCQKNNLDGISKYTPAPILYAMTVDRSQTLKRMGYIVIEQWECDFDKLIKTVSQNEKTCLANLDLVDRIDIRDALYGGRTEAFKLYWKITNGGSFNYADICSLYPFVNKEKLYPIFHPIIITRDFKPIENYFGIALVKILPPQNLYLPVLPYRCDGKLTFPLCAKCAKTQQLTPCTCNDNDRALIGTYITLELHKAVTRGYKIIKIYEVYHYEHTTDELFAEYINTFIGLKTEASGYPINCITVEQKNEYIKQYKEREGIILQPEKIEKNSGLRQIGKAFANNLWGRLSLRDNLNRTAYVRTAEEFQSLVTDPELQIIDFKIINDDVIALIYNSKEQYVPLSKTTNSILSSFTTCYGRLELYNAMEKLGNRVCYCDTDSIMYHTEFSLIKQPHIPLGNYLGQFTDEIPEGKHVIEFCSTGPKCYSLLFNDNTHLTKIRGFTLNHRNSVSINFDVMKNMLLNQDIQNTNDKLHAFTINPSKISRDKKRNIIYNKGEVKRFTAVYTKRVIMSDLTTLPYGHRRE
jgi:G:T-mismatch repair DNA endonuclease (very short patch repair protein)